MLVTILTPPCPICREEGSVQGLRAEYFKWRGGAFIQDAFPTMSAPLREQILTGTHPACWDKLWAEEAR